MGLSLDEMESRSAPRSGGTINVTHVAVVQDEETGIVSRQPIHFCLGNGGVLDATVKLGPDAHLGAVGGE
jgi:hypothetical protein